jgi:hypothetical protein
MFRLRGDRVKNLQAAIVGYTQALLVFRAETLPNDHLQTSRMLGTALLMVGDWRGASKALNAARSTADFLIGQGLNRFEVADILEKASDIGPQAAFAAGKLGDAAGALGELEAGRARQLSIALMQNAVRDLLDPADRDRLDALRSDVHIADRALDAAPEGERQMKLDALIALRQELTTLVNKGLAIRTAADSSLEKRLARLTGAGAVLVAPVFTRAGGS